MAFPGSARFVIGLKTVRVLITVSQDAAGAVLRVDGWLTGGAAEELARALETAATPVRLQLHQLRGTDAAGLAILRSLAARGVALEGLSAYLTLLLASRDPLGTETPVIGEDA